MSISSVYVTTANSEEAKRIGREVIKEKLAACANILPEITSIFRWEDEIQENGESLLLLKTKSELVKELIMRVKSLHSYEIPCIIELKADQCDQLFTRWIDSETKAV